MIKFLFQTGSIRSFDAPLEKHHRRKRFYSKLVRLEVSIYQRDSKWCVRFYSKLVRLEGPHGDWRLRVYSEFLFQTGSIRRVGAQNRGVRPQFLFQTGSIRSSGWEPHQEFPNGVSIPNWFD